MTKFLLVFALGWYVCVLVGGWRQRVNGREWYDGRGRRVR